MHDDFTLAGLKNCKNSNQKSGDHIKQQCVGRWWTKQFLDVSLPAVRRRFERIYKIEEVEDNPNTFNLILSLLAV